MEMGVTVFSNAALTSVICNFLLSLSSLLILSLVKSLSSSFWSSPYHVPVVLLSERFDSPQQESSPLNVIFDHINCCQMSQTFLCKLNFFPSSTRSWISCPPLSLSPACPVPLSQWGKPWALMTVPFFWLPTLNTYPSLSIKKMTPVHFSLVKCKG